MPARKSTASAAPASPSGPVGDASMLSTTTTATADPRSPTTHKGNKQSGSADTEGEKAEKRKAAKNEDIGIDDLLLPRTLTSRLSRGTLPPNTSIQRDALLALTKSATVFISYLAHTANELTSRKTIQSQDILEALRETELWNVSLQGHGGGGGGPMTLGERVRAEVEKWEGEIRGKRKGYRDRVKARESGAGDASGLGDDGEDIEGRGPQAKRVRRGSVDDMDVDPDEEGDEDAAAAQLRGEEAGGSGDATETDPEVAEDEDEEVDEDDGDEDDQDDDDDEDSQQRDNKLDEDGRRRTALAPNGRVEVGSDEESD